jgi:hypothetical protein
MIACKVSGTMSTGDTTIFRENSIPVLLSEPQIPHRLEIRFYSFNALISKAAFVTLHCNRSINADKYHGKIRPSHV